MITTDGIRSAICRLGGWKYFPNGQPDIMADVGRVLRANFQTDEALGQGITWLLFEAGVSEWPGSYEFKQLARQAAEYRTVRRSSHGADPHAEWVPDWQADADPEEQAA